MEKLSEKDLKDPQKIDLYFALGKAYEDLKDYDKSFKYLNEANKIQKKKLIIIIKMTRISLIIFKVYLVN